MISGGKHAGKGIRSPDLRFGGPPEPSHSMSQDVGCGDSKGMKIGSHWVPSKIATL